MADMRVEAQVDLLGTFSGPFFVDEDVELHGIVDGNAYVSPGGTLALYGRILGNLHVQSGGTVTIYGTVEGLVENAGGNVTVEGSVGGVLDHDLTHPILIAFGAVLTGHHGSLSPNREGPPRGQSS
jgi:hypothetical protein